MKTSTPRDAVRLSPNAITVLEKRYLLKDESGAPVETPRDLFQRVARTVADADRRYGVTDAGVDALTQDFFGLTLIALGLAAIDGRLLSALRRPALQSIA